MLLLQHEGNTNFQFISICWTVLNQAGIIVEDENKSNEIV
jgi:hypothetical protein